jgi:DNA polymerase III sliding clamp (beta) subunit (PCNA family)
MKFRTNINDLYKALNSAFIHAHKDCATPYKHEHCVCISIAGDECNVVGTDGQRLSGYKLSIVPEEKDVTQEYLLSYDDVKGLLPILKKDLKTDFYISVDTSDTQMNFELPMNRITVRLVDESFPPWKEIFDRYCKNTGSKGPIGLNPFFLQDAIKAFGIKKSAGVPLLSIQVNDELDPVIITSPREPNLTVVIMPIRL